MAEVDPLHVLACEKLQKKMLQHKNLLRLGQHLMSEFRTLLSSVLGTQGWCGLKAVGGCLHSSGVVEISGRTVGAGGTFYEEGWGGQDFPEGQWGELGELF